MPKYNPSKKLDRTVDYLLYRNKALTAASDREEHTLIYSLSPGSLTDGFEVFTKAGAVSTATISKAGNYDKLVVGAGTQTSYFYPNKQFSSMRNTVKLRIKIDALGAAPKIGFTDVWPGAGYNQFDNTKYYAYVDLLTGIVTASASSDTATSYNSFSGAAAVGDIIEIELRTEYTQKRIFRVTKKNSLTGEISLRKDVKSAPNSDSKLQVHVYKGVVIADGTYTILDYSYTSHEPFESKLMLVGDSMAASVRVMYPDTIVGNLRAKSPFKYAAVCGTSMEQRGLNAVLDEILKLKPQYVAVFNWINPVYQGDVNPADSNYATWNTAILNFAQIIKTAGITPIWMYPEKWALLDPDGVNAAVYETYLNTNFPNDLKIKLYASEVGYDSTGFHFDAITNELVADKLLALLKEQGAII